MIFRGVAISSFDARALDFFGPLRGAGRGPVGRPPSRISPLAGTGRRRTGREVLLYTFGGLARRVVAVVVLVDPSLLVQ